MWNSYTIQCNPQITNNYLSLPSFLANSLQIRYSKDLFCKPIKITRTKNPKHTWILGWTGSISISDYSIEISIHLASTLGLISSESVRIEALYEINWIDRINAKVDIELEELLEEDKVYLEQNILNQLCVIMNNTIYPLYLPNQRMLSVRIDYDAKKYQQEYYLMRVDTELILEFKKSERKEEVVEEREGVLVDEEIEEMVVGVKKQEALFVEISYNKTAAKMLHMEFEDFSKAERKKGTKFHKLEKSKDTSLLFVTKEMRHLNANELGMNMKCYKRLGMYNKLLIKYKFRNTTLSELKNAQLNIVIDQYTKDFIDLYKKAIEHYLSSFEFPFILHHNTKYTIHWKKLLNADIEPELFNILLTLVDTSFSFIVELPKDKKCLLIESKEQINKLQIQIIDKHLCLSNSAVIIEDSVIKYIESYKEFCNKICGCIIICGENAKEVINYVKNNLVEQNVISFDCLNLSLKASMSNSSMKYLKEYLFCKTLAGMKLYRELIIIFEEINALCPANNLSDGDTIKQLKSNFYSSTIIALLDFLKSNRYKAQVLAINNNNEPLNSRLLNKQYFCDIRKVPKIEMKDRIKVFAQEFGELNNEEVKSLAEQTLNYSLSNYNEALRPLKSIRHLEDFKEKALKILQNQKPSSTEHIKLLKGNITFKNVGGMVKQKAELNKIFNWPSKYPELFVKSPIKLPKGVLLYGPSGCGKTLLALSIAKEFGLNLIPVNGAEVLNKYIGASEENLRQIFESARRCAPSVIFFDEFDSLAPIRGSGSTGVTDRLVNQLLCYLDGFEDLGRVYVLAASSRVNAIDPAVLRPGRIDKIVLCGFPNLKERLDILKVAVREFEEEKVEWKVDLEKIASQTEGYTGADLNGILNTAFETVMMKRMNTITTEDIIIKVKPKIEVKVKSINNIQRTAFM